ncbi:gastrula zinc finger protein XlCGF17.1 [Folsomia candida]|uniref:gastrula zinc finger protein XlCGF17.1 n=1 Tax=Folsomia candida TaxID=158441 RepID=UPI000B8EF0DD|nr:gastrula zinc finger protein XlCGF17.1 [Folsomia candida]
MDWIKDAPTFDKENSLTHQACCEFIDEFITCKKDESDDMKEVLAYQIHNHSHTCEDKRRGYNLKNLQNKSNLNRHIASHLGEKPFSCGKCHREFGTSSILDAHQAAHQTEALFQCQLCPKKYKYQSDRKMHMNLIHPSTPHKSTDCHKCGKTFPNNIAVKKHLRLNHGNNTFFCYFCPKRVSNYKVSFEIHVRRHTLEKPFVCREDGCSYSSGSPSDLICHGKWTHKPKIEEETEICYFCGEKILKNDHAVLSHVNKHTMEKAFGCGVCGKLFYGKVEKVQKHIDEKHSRGRRKT